jgi:acyl-CoA thioesterase
MSKPDITTTNIQIAEVTRLMQERDTYSKLLGIEVDEVKEGYCRLHMAVRDDMLNGFNALHGGVTFSAADTALAYACNSHGRIAVALSVTIDYLQAGKLGDILYVEAQEESITNRTGVYLIRVKNQDDVLVAMFKGTAYRTLKEVS